MKRGDRGIRDAWRVGVARIVDSVRPEEYDMPKKMAPFPTLEPRLCANPECKTGPGNTRATYTPTTPWQHCCTTACRMRMAYLKRKAKKESEKSNG